MPLYTIRFTNHISALRGSGLNAAAWRGVEMLHLTHFRPEGSSHRPAVSVRCAYDEVGVCVRFDVSDRFVRSVCTTPNGPVCRDSCVEWFVAPGETGYANFEVNAGGTMHASWVTDPTRLPGGKIKARQLLDARTTSMMHVQTSLPAVVDPEVPGPLEWVAFLSVPWTLFKTLCAAQVPTPGTEWRANFYKCGDHTSHPHWASWAPVAELNFHRPTDFGTIRFDV